MHSRQCAHARELASLRLDSEVSELEQALLEAHLDRCDDCSEFADQLQGFTRELRAAPLERPTAPVALPSRRSLSLRTVQVGAAAALVAVVVGVGSLLAVVGSPDKAAQFRPPLGHFRNDDLRELRELRRAELTFSTAILAQPTRGRAI